MNSSQANEPALLNELHDLMARLSLKGSRALAAVAEVHHDVAEQWLAGSKSIPSEVVVMLRGLASIQGTRDQIAR